MAAQEAFERALEALSRKERTSAELVAWLDARGFGAREVDVAIGRLTEDGALDDRRFAVRFAEDKRELRGWGPDRIREALAARGLERALIEAVVADDDFGERLERAIKLLERRGQVPDDEPGRARALAYLARRGYDSELAYEAVRGFEGGAA